MAVIQAILKNNSMILKFANCELSSISLQSLLRDTSIPYTQRDVFYRKVLKCGHLRSFTSIRNRCLFTGRARAVIKRVHLGRHVYKKLNSGGLVVGWSKA